MAHLGSWLALLLLLGAAGAGSASSSRLLRQNPAPGGPPKPAAAVELESLVRQTAEQQAAGDAAPVDGDGGAATPAHELLAAPAHEPLALVDTAAAPGSCMGGLTYSSVFPPADAHAQYLFRVVVQGTRNFTCQSEPLKFGPAQGLGSAHGVLPDGTRLGCIWYYSSPFEGYLDCSDEATGRHVGLITLDTTVPGSVFVLPAPDPERDEPWGRFRVKVEGGLPPANLAVRHNTSGGLRPEECTAPRGEWQTVPVGATFDYYFCP